MKSVLTSLSKWLKDLDQMIYPRNCVMCGRILQPGEDILCTRCITLLPYTGFKGREGNRVERIFYGIFPIKRANSLLFHDKGAESAKLVHSLKYHDNPEAAVYMGKIMAMDVMDMNFFDGIDGIIPIPLHQNRLKERGYNQSEMLARGIASITNLPIWTDVVIRIVDNPSLTQMGYEERRTLTEGIFSLVNPERIRGKHLLIVDDVITSGSTMMSCMKEMSGLDVSFSVLTLAAARMNTDVSGYVNYDFEV